MAKCKACMLWAVERNFFTGERYRVTYRRREVIRSGKPQFELVPIKREKYLNNGSFDAPVIRVI
jgi:hypothetical protein